MHIITSKYPTCAAAALGNNEQGNTEVIINAQEEIMKSALTVVVFLCMITVATCDLSFAQAAGGPPHQKDDACRADQQKYCAGIPQGGQMGECLDANLKRLSQDCRAAHKNIKRNIAKGLMPGHPLSGCRQDIQKLCASVDNDMGPVMECLMRNEPSLSNNCRTKLREVPPPPGHT